MENVDSVLKDRGERYGSFSQNARATHIAYELFIHDDMPYEIKEATHMILHKLARSRYGDCMYEDNFVDIAGYAKLAAEWIRSQNGS